MSVFMPFDTIGERLKEGVLRKEFPETWNYLKKHKDRLAKRTATTGEGRLWWEPHRPRSRAKLLVPKIVTPHLVLLPRFGIDEKGKYAISHSPYIVPKLESGGTSLLKVICAVMNSAIGHWQLASSSHKYSRGYLMLEVKTLRDFHMPDPASLSPTVTRKILRLVDKLIESPEDQKAMMELDSLVGEAFGLSADQLTVVGVGG
jgi:hypothetical protein